MNEQPEAFPPRSPSGCGYGAAYEAGEDSILRLGLDNRIVGALVRAGVVRVSQLIELVDAGDLQTIRRMGAKSVAECAAALERPLGPLR